MNPEQALQILRNVANAGLTKGGIYTSVDEVASVSHALQVLKVVIEPNMNQTGQGNKPVDSKD